MASVGSALVGYAIGTAQVLALEWFQRRHRHRKDLRLLRAELRRAATFTTRFNLRLGVPPEPPLIPRAPNVSSRFLDTVTATDFWLTDVEKEDNTQEALLTIADSCTALDQYLVRIKDRLSAFERTADEFARDELRADIMQRTAWYDGKHQEVLDGIRSALADMERRVSESTFPHQVKRFLHLAARRNDAV